MTFTHHIRTRHRGHVTGTWHTGALSLSQYVSRHPNKRGGVDMRTYTIITTPTGEQLQLKWSELKQLHTALTELMAETSTLIGAGDSSVAG